jgi:hypothetical protein
MIKEVYCGLGYNVSFPYQSLTFRCPIESGLDVRINALVVEARGAKVDHFYGRTIGRFQQHIFRLQITVD